MRSHVVVCAAIPADQKADVVAAAAAKDSSKKVSAGGVDEEEGEQSSKKRAGPVSPNKKVKVVTQYVQTYYRLEK